jgi:hypothetical protein
VARGRLDLIDDFVADAEDDEDYYADWLANGDD